MPEKPSKVLKIGDKGEEVKKLHKFLQDFGYMKSGRREILGFKLDLARAIDQPEKEDIFDTNTVKALKLFQEFNKLPKSGILDEVTLDLMSKPRCGVPDIVEVDQVRFAIVSPWSKISLTYSFENFTTRLPQEVIRSFIETAFNKWASVSSLKFCEATSEGNIRIGWFVWEHGDGWPFDGPAKVLGHAFYPEDGRVHFDDDEGWTNQNFLHPALHELGHAIGLGHSEVPNAVMWGSYNGQTELQADDIAGIQSLYAPFSPISVREILTAAGISFPASIDNIIENLGLSRPISIKQLICHLQQ